MSNHLTKNDEFLYMRLWVPTEVIESGADNAAWAVAIDYSSALRQDKFVGVAYCVAYCPSNPNFPNMFGRPTF